jgi:hypothetical protein
MEAERVRMNAEEITQNVLIYFVLPVWLAAGFADYLCHRAAHIESTSGAKESLLHFLQFGEMAVAVLTAMFLQINALVLLTMLVCFVLHEATALWDVRYASATREVTPVEQHVHSFLEMMPLMGLVLIAALHWGQFLALFGLGNETARFDVAIRSGPPSWIYVGIILILVLLFEILPYLEELVRGLRANHGALVPRKSRRSG